MLSHDFVDMPGAKPLGRSAEDMVLRCRFCMHRPADARQDGCPARELEEVGQILLGDWNPDGVEYFKGRTCVTCEMPIMGHWLRRGQGDTYWCHENQNQFSYGVNGCVHELNGVTVPEEPTHAKGL
jgi:hypothetical protein